MFGLLNQRCVRRGNLTGVSNLISRVHELTTAYIASASLSGQMPTVESLIEWTGPLAKRARRPEH